MEYYDIASNQWHGASPIPWRFVSLKCVAVKDMIYVLAGRGFERALPLKYVLEYHTRTNRLVQPCIRTVNVIVLIKSCILETFNLIAFIMDIKF